MQRRILIGVFAMLVISGIATTAWSQMIMSSSGSQSEPEFETIEITVTPATEPVPAFRYDFLPRQEEVGDAVVHYYRALALYNHHMDETERDAENSKAQPVTKEGEEPLSISQQIAVFDGDIQSMSPELRMFIEDDIVYQIMEELDFAARRKNCEWNLRIKERRDPYLLALPDVQEFRALAQFVRLLAMHKMAGGDYEEACTTIGRGYALGRGLTKCDTLIHGLVGAGVIGLMDTTVLEMSQHPDAPNFYWAVTSLPRPLFDLQAGILSEIHMVDQLLPEFDEVTNQDRTPEYWNMALRKSAEELLDSLHIGDRKDREFRSQATITALSAISYPRARKTLAEMEGLTEAEIDQMPTGQIIGLYVSRSLERRFIDEMRKRESLSASERARYSKRHPFDDRLAQEDWLLRMFSVGMPAWHAVTNIPVRHEQQVARQRVIEAIRLYAAANEGQLPESLDELDETAPVPVDPVTQKPFDYAIEDGKGVLSFFSYRYHRDTRYVITIAKP